MARLCIALLGPFQVTLDGQLVAGFESAKVGALLAFLAADAAHSHTRAALAELLWPEHPPGAAQADLRHALASLRKSIGDATAQSPFLLITQTTLQFNLASDAEVDLVSFMACFHGGECPTPAACEAALALRRGAFLAGFKVAHSPPFEEWLVVAAEQVDHLTGLALTRLAKDCEERGDFVQATFWTRQHLAIEPWNEEVHQRLIWQLAASGQPSAALHHYEICRQLLAKELGVAPQPATAALVDRIRNGEIVPPPMVTPPHPATRASSLASSSQMHLPPRPPAFFGRKTELEQIATRLADPACRLLTVLAPGGMGKTLLAIEAARAQREHFADGVWFVDLAPVNAPDHLAVAMLRSLGLPPAGPDAATVRLMEHLQARQTLLVLDNFEHLAAGAEFLPSLLNAAPALKLLVTSRVRLQLADEWLLPLEGLETPPAALSGMGTKFTRSEGEPEDLHDVASVGLFLQQVQRLDPSYDPTSADLEQIGEICRLLEGMPLAIELAAAWNRSLTLAEIATAVRSGLDLLTTPLRDVPTRHRSMFAVFDHSWRLLGDRQRTLLRQLAVFRGGCNLAAATAVAGATPADMEGLIDASWLRTHDRRFTFHELMRQYCLAKLEQEYESESGEPAGAVHRRHCIHFAGMVTGQDQTMNWRRESMSLFSADFGNLEAAWQWAIEHEELAAIQKMMVGLFFVAEMTGWCGVMLPYFGRAATVLRARWQQLGPKSPQRQETVVLFSFILYIEMVLLLHLGWLARLQVCLNEARTVLDAVADEDCWQEQDFMVRHATVFFDLALGNFAATQAAARKQLDYLVSNDFPCYPWRAEIGTRFWQMHVHHTLGVSARFLGDYGTAQSHDQAAIDLCDEMGERRFKARNLREQAILLQLRGDYDQAEALIHTALALSHSFEDRLNAAYSEMRLGLIECDAGRYLMAREHCRRSLALGLETGILALHVRSLTGLARVERLAGDPAAARSRLEEARIACTRPEIPHSTHLAGIFLEMGHVACAEGDWVRAQQCYADALAAKGCDAAEAQEALAGLAEAAWAGHKPALARQLLVGVLANEATAYATRQRAEDLLACWGLELAVPSLDDDGDVLIAPANVAFLNVL
ncbi:BTAD domain-containing putative transcriptional regulator [Caldilinea sp.]|uniref:ATP-binding protein n=1 Tax=Caldilinea sp. TaxID=2293560 RepID=UPI002B62D4DC|nr:BTAD domain-containing putative transcriptional regulator [Caldilinea sp.]